MSVDPRNTAEWRHNVAEVLALSDLCHLCGHHGAKTGDHLISIRDWPPGVPGVNSVHNIAPAHGARGPFRANRCEECVALGRNGMCNQSRGSRSLTPQPRSRDW